MSAADLAAYVKFEQTTASRIRIVEIAAIVLLATTWLTLALRFFVRGLMIVNIGWDDAAMLATNIVYTFYCAFNILGYHTGLKIVQGKLPVTKSVMVVEYFVAVAGLYILTALLLKIALGLLYLRMVTKKWQRQTIYFTMGATTLYGTFHLLFTVFQCGNPWNFGIDNYETNSHCVGGPSLLGINLTAGLINAAADWIFALLPISVLRKANIPRSAKISVICIILFGAVGSVASVVRLVYIEGYKPSTYFLTRSVPFGTCSVVECGVGITAGCMATLRPVFHRVKQGAQSMITPNASRVHGGGGTSQSQILKSDPSSSLSKSGNDTVMSQSTYLSKDDGRGTLLSQSTVDIEKIAKHDGNFEQVDLADPVGVDCEKIANRHTNVWQGQVSTPSPHIVHQMLESRR